jgi:hypothetical protein
VVHEQSCDWCPGRALYQSRTVRWKIRVVGLTGRPPESIPYGQRCPTTPGPWPSFHDPAKPLGWIRIQLTAELGRLCIGRAAPGRVALEPPRVIW